MVLIPSYQPDARLVALVRALRRADRALHVVIVDDGSGERWRTVFADAATAGARILRHSINRGKGAALKTGFVAAAAWHPGHAVVTADGDGQHTPADIVRIARHTAELNQAPGAPCVVLGVRAFTGAVPARSRLGNGATRAVFRLVTGEAVRDTQTGLRGIPAGCLPWLQTIAGERFEYEFRMLLQARGAGVRLAQEPIATVYADGNASSHFRPVADSLRIYAPIARFAASAILAFILDTALLLLVNALTGWLLLSVVTARIASAGLNFAINRRLVFRRGREVPVRTAALRYLSLAALLLAANFGTLTALTDAGVPLLAAKLLTEATLFLVSFSVQRSVVFAPPPDTASSPAVPAAGGIPSDPPTATNTPMRACTGSATFAASGQSPAGATHSRE